MKVDAQKMQARLLTGPQGLFDFALMFAKGEVQTQTEDGDRVRVTVKQRQMWARIVVYVAQTIDSIASGFDEKELDVQPDELQRMVNEVNSEEKSRGYAGDHSGFAGGKGKRATNTSL